MIKEKIKIARHPLICLGIRLKFAFMLVFLADEYVVFINSRMPEKNCIAYTISKPTLSMVESGIEKIKRNVD